MNADWNFAGAQSQQVMHTFYPSGKGQADISDCIDWIAFCAA